MSACQVRVTGNFKTHLCIMGGGCRFFLPNQTKCTNPFSMSVAYLKYKQTADYFRKCSQDKSALKIYLSDRKITICCRWYKDLVILIVCLDAVWQFIFMLLHCI